MAAGKTTRIEDLLAVQPSPTVQTKEGREDDHRKYTNFSLRLEAENGDSPSVLYGTLLGGPYFNPSRGIQFVFEGAHAHGWDNWEWGVWTVSIMGHNLESAYHFISESRETFMRVGEKVTEISIRKLELKGYAQEGGKDD